MLAAAGVPVVVQALVEVRLAVAVEVVQPGQLAALQHDDLAVHHLQPERLVQPRGETLPGELFAAFSSTPLTSQTSPWQVQTAIRPSGRKSTPVTKNSAL